MKWTFRWYKWIMVPLLLIIMVNLIFLSRGILATSIQVTEDEVILTDQEKAYIQSKGTIKISVDPDWYPYESIDETGAYKGIASDLVKLIGERTGLKFELVPTKDWDESVAFSKAGKCDALTFLNETPERREWLDFSDVYYEDPNVMITREEHDYISDLSRLSGESIVLPKGTSVEEKVRRDYPNLKIILVDSEAAAIEYVSQKQADLTIRSLTMSAYVIKSQGLFNLKIAGQIPAYTNQFRMGIRKDEVALKSIINKGIQTITPEEVQGIINKYIVIKVGSGFNYQLFFILVTLFGSVLLVGIVWNVQLRRYNRKMAERQKELTRLSEELAKGEERYKKLADELAVKNNLLNERIGRDELTGIGNRYYFDQRIMEEIQQADRYGTALSMMMIDLDLFKVVNDTFGHDVGDQVLVNITGCIKGVVRKTDVFARWGGEEFVVLMTQTDSVGATQTGEKIRKSVEELNHENVGNVTISIGIAQRKKGETIESWFRRTDQALYRAKNNGRNQVCLSDAGDTKVYLAIEWQPSWESGNQVIDDQHKELLEIANQMIGDIFTLDAFERFENDVAHLINHLSIHFHSEEQLMGELKFNDIANHVKCHHKLLEEVGVLKQKVLTKEIKLTDMIDFIVHTLVMGHLLEEDVKYFQYIEKH